MKKKKTFTKKVLFKVLLSPCLSLQHQKQHWAFSEVKHEVAALWWLCLGVTAHTEKKRSHLVHGAAQLSRRHADDDSSRLQSGNLLLGTPFASGNDGSCVPHSPSRRGCQASNEWHHWLSIGTLKNEQKKQWQVKRLQHKYTHLLFWMKFIFIYRKDVLAMCQVTTLTSERNVCVPPRYFAFAHKTYVPLNYFAFAHKTCVLLKYFTYNHKTYAFWRYPAFALKTYAFPWNTLRTFWHSLTKSMRFPEIIFVYLHIIPEIYFETIFKISYRPQTSVWHVYVFIKLKSWPLHYGSP